MSSLRIWCQPDALIVLAADAPDHIAAGVGEAVADVNGQIADRVISAVTADGVADAPPFLFAAIVDQGVRILVRGTLTAQATGDDGTTADISAGRASTWRDDVVRDVRRIDLLDDDRPWVTWMPRPAGEPVASSAPEPVTRADPENTLDDAAFDQLVESASGPHDTLAPPEEEVAEGVEEEPDVADPSPAVAAGADDETTDEAGDEPAGDDDFLGLLTDTSHLGHAPEPTGSQDAAEPPPPVESPPETEPGPESAPAPDPAPEHAAPEVPPAPAPEPTEPPGRPPLITGIPPAPSPQAPPPERPTPAAAPAQPPPPDPGAAPSPLPPPPSAPPPPPPRPASPPAPEPVIGTGLDEHDGMTISVADLHNPSQPAPAPAPEPPLDGAQVQAVYCPLAHANPVDEPQCRVCGQMIADRTPVTIPRPVIACMTFDSGLMVDIDRPQLIGRRPSVMPDSGGEIPNLVSLPSPEGEISRHHLAIHLEGWEVLIEDLASTNGTELMRPGQPVIRLRSHEPTLATPGSTVVLAGTVRFTLNHPDH